MRTAIPLTLLATTLACSLSVMPAQAQSIRTFVSTAGSDSNPCSLTQPCRHFSAAVAATAAGGEVDALDAGAYGSFTISQAITIEGQGWSYVAPPNNGNAITINGGSGNVTIRGVSLNGVGATGGTNGIVFNSDGNLTVTDCVVQNFVWSGSGFTTGNGILMRPTANVKIAITNTIIANNFGGITFLPSNGSSPNASLIIDHVIATNNSTFGIYFDLAISPGTGTADVAISNSIASNNNADGIVAGGGQALTISIDNSTMNGNSLEGISANAPASILLSRSVIQGNGTGIHNGTSNTFYTYGNNLIDLNGNNFSGSALNTSVTLR